jgi:hypothetical protein
MSAGLGTGTCHARCSPQELLAVHVERDLAGEHEPLVGGQLVGERAQPAEVITATDVAGNVVCAVGDNRD